VSRSGSDNNATHAESEIGPYIAGHFLSVVAEWASYVGMLVYAFERGGARLTGMASIAMLLPYVVVAPFTARWAQLYRPQLVRRVALAVQCAGYALAAAATLADLPVAWPTLGCMMGLGAVTALRPSGAVLLPALVHSSRDLTTANLWTSYSESTSILAGPLLATGLLAVGRAPAVLTGCACIAAISLVIAVVMVRVDPAAANDTSLTNNPSTRPFRGVLRHGLSGLQRLAQRPGLLSVLGAQTAQYVLVGSLDVIIVVVAHESLHMSKSGTGVLTSLFGAGAFLSAAAAGRAVRRKELAPLMVLALAMLAAGTLTLGLSTRLVTAMIALPLLGFHRSLLDLMARVLMQRAAPPSELATVFGTLEMCSGIGMLAGSILAQGLMAVSSGPGALMALGGMFTVLLAVLYRSLRMADASADVPVVAMSLLRQTAVFEHLPTLALEAVARAAIELPVTRGTDVITQGDVGDRFYVVASGQFDVRISGRLVRTVTRGEAFGEVALLADVPRTATITAVTDGQLLAVDRQPFLLAVTGHDSIRVAAWGEIRNMQLSTDLKTEIGTQLGTDVSTL
jgi:CRP-like cAMP-binding protein